MRVSVEEVMYLLSRISEINEQPLDSITWTSFGKDLSVPPKVIEDWKFIGLSNVWFIQEGVYLRDSVWDEEDVKNG